MARDDFHQRARRHPRRRNKQGRHQPLNRDNAGASPQGRMNFDEVIHRYEKLMESHMDARRKYFEFYYRSDERERTRLEDNFNRTLRDWRYFEDHLPEPQRVLLEKKYDSLDLDVEYTEIHQLENDSESEQEDEQEGQNKEEDNKMVARPVITGPFPDPHTTEAQKLVNYKNDVEQSIGTIEDYKKYKGI